MSSTLGARFTALRGNRERAADPVLDPGEALFEFGKHKGRSFCDVFDNEGSYVKWSTSHLTHTSGKNQKQWLEYIEKKVTELERENAATGATGTEPAHETAAAVNVRLEIMETSMLEVEQRVVNLENLMSQLVVSASSTGSQP